MKKLFLLLLAIAIGFVSTQDPCGTPIDPVTGMFRRVAYCDISSASTDICEMNVANFGDCFEIITMDGSTGNICTVNQIIATI